MAKKSVIVIGSGFAGLSAASFMAKEGWDVLVIEKNDTPGGRASQIKEQGFTFDKGPSFYWMPDVFERYFAQFEKNVNDYYQLHRLDPSYRVYWKDSFTDIPASFDELKKQFEAIEPGSGDKLEKYLRQAEYKYKVGINKLVYKPGRSFIEFIDWDVIKGVFKLDVLTSIKKHIAKYFTSPHLRQIMEFPVLFLGALPKDTPALYSLMNYADIKGGTWYPNGGMYSVVDAMYKLAVELGVKFHFNEEAKEFAYKLELDPTACALSGGEDYELLFTVPQTHYEKIKTNPSISIIGYITEASEGKNIITRGGNKHELIAQGWNHLK